MRTRAAWTFRLLFLGLSLATLFFALLPFGPGEGRFPAPDLILCLTLAWIVRRPDYVPLWLLLPLLLLGDMLTMRPLGLWALIVLLLSEYLRRRVDYAEAQTFWSEVVQVSGVIAVAFVLNHLALLLLLAETPPLGGQALQAVATIVFYPLTAIFSHLIGVRRLAPGELSTQGSRA